MRLLIASGVGNLVLLLGVIVLLTGRGELTARIDELERSAAGVERARDEDAKRVADLQLRNGALVTAQAQACGVEGSTAFDRGVRTGMAVCQARNPAR